MFSFLFLSVALVNFVPLIVDYSLVDNFGYLYAFVVFGSMCFVNMFLIVILKVDRLYKADSHKDSELEA